MMPNRQTNNNLRSCLIIGGGISGLIAATILQREGIKVTVLDKGRGIGGRLATRRIDYSDQIKGIFDYGTQYFSVSNPQFRVWVDDWIENGIIKEWCGSFHSADSQVSAEDKPRYCGENGTRSIAKYLARDLDVRTSTKVVKLNWQDSDSQWTVETEDKKQFQGDMLILTPPVPQSLALLNTSHIAIPEAVRNRLERVNYYQCIAVLALLATPSQIPSPGGLSPEPEPLAWLASNYQKGISPQGYAVTLHATPQFSKAHWENDDEQIAKQLLDAASTWLGSEILQYQVHRWRYSLPQTFYGEPYLALSNPRLMMAGDAFVAPKIEGAVLSGIAAAKYVVA